MSQININGPMYRKKIVRGSGGNIIDLLDEADGGWIIRKGQVVNPEKYAELQKKQKDKEEAAKVLAMGIADPASFHNPQAPTEDRTAAPSKIEELEKKVEGMESKLDAILSAINKKS